MMHHMSVNTNHRHVKQVTWLSKIYSINMSLKVFFKSWQKHSVEIIRQIEWLILLLLFFFRIRVNFNMLKAHAYDRYAKKY